MKKVVIMFLLFAIILSSSFAFAESSTKAENDDLIQMLESAFSSFDLDYLDITMNEEKNMCVINIAVDGLAESAISIHDSGTQEEFYQWEQFRQIMVNLHSEVLSFFREVGREDLNLILSVVNDDAYFREDYKTIQYNPLLSVGIFGIICVDTISQ